MGGSRVREAQVLLAVEPAEKLNGLLPSVLCRLLPVGVFTFSSATFHH